MSAMLPTPLGVLTAALGRSPSQQELIDLSPVAVMVQAFCATGRKGDELTMQVEQWNGSFLFGLIENNGQKMELKITRGVPPLRGRFEDSA